MDRGLDEIISSRQAEQRSNRSNRGGRNGRRDPPRDNNRKVYRILEDVHAGTDDLEQSGREAANLDDEWIHDKFDEDDDSRRSGRRGPRPGRYSRESPDPFGRDRDRDRGRDKPQGTTIQIDNLHWDITTAELRSLVTDVGPISSINIHYDDMDRSTGRAEVTFIEERDARDAVRSFDGANAKGQPIKVRILPSGTGGGGRNPLDRAEAPTRSLLDRVEGGRSGTPGSRNRDRNRSRSPGTKRAELRANAPEDIDRYVPEDRGGNRSRRRSPRRDNDRGDRDGGRRGGRGGDSRRGGRFDDAGHKIVGGRPRMTQEELDKDMDDYFKKTQAAAAAADTNSAPADTGNAGVADDDIDMVE